MNAQNALLNTEDHYHHRLLRSQLNPFFSITRIRQLEPALKKLVDKLCRRLDEFKNTGSPVHIEHALTCYATDAITDYTMGEGYHYLDEPDFIPAWCHMIRGAGKTMTYFRPIGFLMPLFVALPESVTAWLNPGMELFFAFQRRCQQMIADISKEFYEGGQRDAKEGPQNIFENILASKLPETAKNKTRLWQDMQIFVAAGAETTAKAMCYIMFYLHHQPDILEKLNDELAPLGDDPSLLQLEQLPYLVSCTVNEWERR